MLLCTGFMSAFMAGAVQALKDQPVINAVIDGSDIVYRDSIDISVAVASPKVLHGSRSCRELRLSRLLTSEF